MQKRTFILSFLLFYIKNLYTPDLNLYTEIGYSVNVIELINIGAFTSFRKGNYDAFGVRLSFNLKGILER